MVLVYGVLLAGGAFALQWLEYQYLVRRYTVEFYIVVLCVLFTIMGIWVGQQLTSKRGSKAFQPDAFALQKLRISERENQVLSLLARGHSNDEIASLLHISLNTVKTHLKSLYYKLGVNSRTLAVSKARSLRILA